MSYILYMYNKQLETLLINLTVVCLLCCFQKRPLASETPKGPPKKIARVEDGKLAKSLTSVMLECKKYF